MKIKEEYKPYIKALIPSAIAFTFNCFCYISPKFFINPENYVYIKLPIDDMIPFVPAFLIFYFGSFLQWFFYYVNISFVDSGTKYRWLTGEMLGKLISWFCFVFFPVSMTRPEITGNSIFSFFMRLVYAVDTPSCLFPSLHCFQAWMHARYCLKYRSWKISVPVLIFTIFVCASTVLIKQHLFMDIIGGLLIPELCIWFVSKTSLPDKFREFCDRLAAKIK